MGDVLFLVSSLILYASLSVWLIVNVITLNCLELIDDLSHNLSPDLSVFESLLDLTSNPYLLGQKGL